LTESYLRKVRECDIFVLLLGRSATDPVKEEARTATAAGKPRLIFVDAAAPTDVVKYAQSLGEKYATYRDAGELGTKVAEAVGDELIRGYRDHHVPLSDLPPIIAFLEKLAAGSLQIAGSVIGGSVDNRGGFFVGGNYTVTVAPDAPPLDLMRAYYASLEAECRRLPLGVIDVEFVRTSGEQPIPLPDIYVDLDVVAAPEERPERSTRPFGSVEAERAWALRLARGEGRDRTPLLDALAAPAVVRTMLLGDPGSGKTTFVNYLAYLLCQGSPALPEGWRGLLPVCLVLRDVAARHIPAEAATGTAQMLWNALQGDIAARLGADAAGKLLPYLRDRLLKEGGLILLDGLDEVPEARRRRATLLAAVRELADVLSKTPSRIVVTARPYAYADRQWRLPRFTSLALAPFNEAQIGRFVDRWYAAVRPFMGWSPEMAQEKAGRLRLALNERLYLGDLASRPLLLTLMATLHSSWGQLPEDRAGLYEETVRLLLGRWQRLSETKGPDGELVMEPGITQALGAGEERIRAALEVLAFTAHDRQRRGPERDEGPADVAEGDVLLAFKPLLGSLDPDELLRYLRACLESKTASL
jgi:energy-coupling factor transporter ATP-binding protein EcfA2